LKRVWISALESSADEHGARFVEIYKKSFHDVEFVGIPGPKLRALGVRQVLPMEQFQVMGFAAVIARLPSLLLAISQCRRSLRTLRVDAAVFIDAPDFHFRLFKVLAGTPIHYFIPPKVWIWRKERMDILEKYCKSVWSIFPFEKDWYEKEGSTLHVRQLPNPTVEALKKFSEGHSKIECRSKLCEHFGITPNPSELWIAFLPGSRPSEIKSHLGFGLECLSRLVSEGKRIRVFIPSLKNGVIKQDQLSHFPFPIHVGVDLNLDMLRACDLGLIKSGTSTLEAAVLGLPHLILYQPSRFSMLFVKYWVKYSGPIGLVNLFLRGPQGSTQIVEEFVNQSIDRVANALSRLCQDGAMRAHQQTEFLELFHSERDLVEADSFKDAVVDLRSSLEQKINKPMQQPKQHKEWASLVYVAISILWSLVNWMRRQFFAKTKPEVLAGVHVISIGNIEVGGTGKTPLVEDAISRLVKAGKRVAVASRGYKSAAEEKGVILTPGEFNRGIGDEAMQIRAKFPGIYSFVGRNRLRLLEDFAKQNPLRESFDVLILDDGHQHFAIPADFSVCAYAGGEWGRVLFRDFGFGDSDLVIWTKGWKRPKVEPFARVQMCPVLTNAQLVSQTRYWLISGVGRFSDLKKSLISSGFDIQKDTEFDDHHIFTSEELDQLGKKVQGYQLICTQKDFAKIQMLGSRLSFHVVDVDVKWLKGETLWVNGLRL